MGASGDEVVGIRFGFQTTASAHGWLSKLWSHFGSLLDYGTGP